MHNVSQTWLAEAAVLCMNLPQSRLLRSTESDRQRVGRSRRTGKRRLLGEVLLRPIRRTRWPALAGSSNDQRMQVGIRIRDDEQEHGPMRDIDGLVRAILDESRTCG